MIVQLNPQIPLVTPLGKAWAVALVDYSQEHDYMWICFQDDTGACWTWRNQDVKAQKNITIGRNYEKSNSEKS